MKRRRYPLVLRLERVDRELDHTASLLGWHGSDILRGMAATTEVEARVILIAAVIGAGLLSAGVESKLVVAWLGEMDPAGDLKRADRLGTQIVEQLMTLFGTTGGKQ